MGNSSSRAVDWDSDEGGGSDHEHAYNYHTSILRKSPVDGFESDYDDDDDDDDARPINSRQLRVLPSRNVKTIDANDTSASTSAAVTVSDGGDKNRSSAADAGGDVPSKPHNVDKGHDLRHLSHTSGDAGHGPDSSAQAVGHGLRPGSRKGHEAQHSDNMSQALKTTGQTAHSTRQISGQTAHSTRQISDPVRQNLHNTRQTSDSSRQIPDPPRQTSHSTRQTSSASVAQAQQAARQEITCREGSTRAERSTTRQHDTRGDGNGEEEEVYETAGEGSGEEGADIGSDDGSLSTITPPRTRPQSDSEYSVTEETHDEVDSEDDSEEEEDEEEEEDSDEDELDYDTVTENMASHSSRSSPAARRQGRVSRQLQSQASQRSTPPSAVSRSPAAARRSLPRRQEMSPQSFRMARKRPSSPKPQIPSKRSKPSAGIRFSPDRTRYGIFDSESDSETVGGRREGRKRRAAPPSPPPLPPRTPPESRSLSARTLRQAAQQAASQFVQTSKKILQDAKTAARILRESTSKRRSSTTLDQEDGLSVGKKPSPDKREARNSPRTARTQCSERNTSPRLSADTLVSGNRRGGTKRKAQDAESPKDRRKRRQRTEMESDSDSEIDDTPPNRRSASWRQVRKDGGRLRKFTRNSTVTSPQSSRRSPRLLHLQPLSSHSVSLPMLPGANINATPSHSSPHNTRLNNSFPSTANPFQNVTLRPSNSRTSVGSIDSISHELGGMAALPSPFTSLTTDLRRSETPPPLTLSAGSIWARISARMTHSSQPSRDQGQNQLSPVPGTSGTRMATRATPQVVATAYPAHSTPRVPSVTLTGQFAQNGRFAFLLENELQVTVVADSITTSTTKAIVITTNSHLQHTGPVSESVAKSAGPGFAQACQVFVRRNARGLQACEVLDTPAGGELPALISHVLHVIVPETDTTNAQDVGQQRKMLLCTYLNCLKHASEKLRLPSLTFPLIGADSYSADECVQVFFDSLLVYLAERTPACPLHAIHLVVNKPALARFAAEVLEARLQTLKTTSVDVAMAAVFRDYFNIPDFSRSGVPGGGVVSPNISADRSPSGKPAVKRRRL